VDSEDGRFSVRTAAQSPGLDGKFSEEETCRSVNRIVTSKPESVNWGSQKMFSTEYRPVGGGSLLNLKKQ